MASLTAERDALRGELKRTVESITADVKKLDEMRPRVKALGDQRDAAEATLKAVREAFARIPWGNADVWPRFAALDRLLAPAPEQPG